jgi:putative ABC transport system permease protein
MGSYGGRYGFTSAERQRVCEHVRTALGAVREDRDQHRPVGPGYLEALGARVVAGRFFAETDTPGGDPVAIVSESAARQHWPAGAVGQWIHYFERPVLIVGVLNDVRRWGWREPAPTLYLPSAQTANFWANNLLVRTSGDPHEVLPAIRAVDAAGG